MDRGPLARQGLEGKLVSAKSRWPVSVAIPLLVSFWFAFSFRRVDSFFFHATLLLGLGWGGSVYFVVVLPIVCFLDRDTLGFGLGTDLEERDFD